VLEIAGVAPGTIVADYVITADRMELILGRYRADPALADRMATVPAYRFSVEAATMERFLGELSSRFGGARTWATASGVPAATLDRMVDLLVEPMP